MPCAASSKRQRARHGQQRRLGGVVQRHALAALDGVAGGDVDDGALAALAQQRQRGAAVVGVAQQVDAEHCLPLGGRGLGERRVVAHRGVVHQHVEAAEGVGAVLHRLLRRAFVGDVGGDDVHAGAMDALADGRGGAVQRRRIAIDQHHAGALLAEQGGGGGADAGATARDQGHLAREAIVHNE
jgi:hypothetical protein